MVDLNFEEYLLTITKVSTCEEIEIIQSLWSNYGRISRYQLNGSPSKTVVVKFIDLEKADEHPRGWNTDFSHQRKIKSYAVETNWYRNWNQLCGENCRTPKFIGSFSKGKNQWIILEDLNDDFPLRKYQVDLSEIGNCLKWLAHFHANFMNETPEGLWEIGTYWHLDTRPDEFKEIKNQELKSKAHLIDARLNQCQFKTIVHGDAKLANFCFSENGNAAAVDFQYVGGGCGMKDVVYFMGSCLSGEECELYEKELLDLYFSELAKALELNHSPINFLVLEKEWREMYAYACVDFIRFLLGWMPSHQKINDYNLRMMDEVLRVMV